MKCINFAHRGFSGKYPENTMTAFEKAIELNCSKIFIGIVEENAVLQKWYEMYGFVHTGIEKYDFFPFTCGYMEKKLV